MSMIKDLSELGEFGLIDRLTKSFVPQHESTEIGVGDDAAVLDYGNNQVVVSTDMLVEGIHFDLSYTPLKHLGYKAVVVNLSDIAAMNARPKQILVSLAISNRFGVESLDELYSGIKQACDYYKIDLIGGDTTSSQKGLIISVTAIGKGRSESICTRRGAKAGDLICVSGDLGAAYIGIQVLEREKEVFLQAPTLQPELEGFKYQIGRFLKPEARIDLLDLFVKYDLEPTSMIDISDGLASELFHIAKQSDVGLIIDENMVPIHPDTEYSAIDLGLDPITCALSGGEDYELLFTIAPKDADKIKYFHDVAICGEIVPKADGLTLHTKGGNIHKLKAQGWRHF